ncbi:hypothetical protein KQ41_02370 [Lysinibacillus fusiformis]|uniref:hypothetical protein n=1 Tax=Lysinibacillus fusiformis TaxID=28031 RepID=UPI0005075412|nr:hypothetical protein [Lysinibacillus fusiformis]KGA84644.1 hypothetical protein KQ41_02370 [Lysinibacillus fusiformis]
MGWLYRVEKNIFPLSQEKINIRKALNEWKYEGEMYDLEVAEETCEICDHPNIRYQFEIVNKFNGNTLLIGSECITKFEIPVLDSNGVRLSSNEAKKKVNRDRRKLVTEAKEKHVIHSLIRLKAIEEEFEIDSFIDYYKKRRAFTPNQLSTLIWRLDKAKVEYNKSNFKVIITKDREKEQLLKMEEWKLKKIWLCLSPSQRKHVEHKI